MTAMPSLQGSVGYIFTSCDLNVKSSGDVRFKDMIERFKVYDHPRRPEEKEEEWLSGEKVNQRGMFWINGCLLPQVDNYQIICCMADSFYLLAALMLCILQDYRLPSKPPFLQYPTLLQTFPQNCGAENLI